MGELYQVPTLRPTAPGMGCGVGGGEAKAGAGGGGPGAAPLLQPGSAQARSQGDGAAPGRVFDTFPATLLLKPSRHPAKVHPSALNYQPTMALYLVLHLGGERMG